MANTYLKLEERIRLNLAELYRRTNFSELVTRFDGRAFIGALNDTLHYTLPGMTRARDYEWRTRNAPIIFDEIYRTKLNIVLNQHMTQGVKFTDEEELLDLDGAYRTDIVVPQMQAIADRFDAKTTAGLIAADWAVTNLDVVATGDANGAGALRAALALKAKLDAAGCPAMGRRLVLGANPFAWFAGSDALQKYDVEQARTAFRRGVFGRIANFDIVDGTQQLGENVITAAHPSWAILANASPMVPAGIPWGVRGTFQGWSLRLIRAYDISYATERSLANTFWGLSEVKDQYARYTAATIGTATDGSEVGDVIILDGEPTFTGKNARGGKGTFTPA